MLELSMKFANGAPLLIRTVVQTLKQCKRNECVPCSIGSYCSPAPEGSWGRDGPWEGWYLEGRADQACAMFSLTDLKADEKSMCTLPEATGSAPQEIDPSKENQLLFTYSVHWEVRQ